MPYLIGTALTIIIIIGLGLTSSKGIKTSVEFSINSRNAGTGSVFGSILGTMMGGAATVGTAQLAYMYGFSAWWFTLGSGIACVLIGVFLSKPLLKNQFDTIPQLLSSEYGSIGGLIAAFFMAIELFFNIIPQVVSCIALFSSIFMFNEVFSALLTITLMALYVVLGGMKGLV